MKKKTARWVIVTAVLAMIFSSINVWAEEEEGKPTGSADIGIFSKYIWRGYELSKGSVVIQPSMTIGYRAFSLNLWSNLDSDVYGDNQSEPQLNETDLTLAYETSFGSTGLAVAYIYYGLDGMDDSREFYVSINRDILLAPTLTVYREVAHLPSWYVNLGVSHSFDLSNEITLDLAGSVGYYTSDDDTFVETDSQLIDTTKKYSALHDGLFSVGLAVPFAQYFTFSPMLAYSFPLSNDADNRLTADSLSNDSAFLFGGATLSIAF